MNKLPPQEYLLRRLGYDAVSGALYWKERPASDFGHLPVNQQARIHNSWNTKYSGRPALTSPGGEGYLVGTIDNVSYLAHRVIWKMVAGYDARKVDHKNGLRTQNFWENLKDADDHENAANQAAHCDGKTGIRGVSIVPETGHFRAGIFVHGQRIYLGTYRVLEHAVEARAAADKQYGFTSRNTPRI